MLTVSSDRLTEVRHIMGMPIGIDLRDADGVDIDVGAAFAWLREVDATFSTYRDNSDISRLDRGELPLAECRPEVDEVLTRCLELSRATDGFFSARPAGRLDPSGYVKGWAVAGAATRLAAAGGAPGCHHPGGARRPPPPPGSPRRARRGAASTRAATSSPAAGRPQTGSGASASATPRRSTSWRPCSPSRTSRSRRRARTSAARTS